MYKIESLYEPVIEGLLTSVTAGRSERWMAAAAFWFGKQQMYNAKEYWLALGAKILSQLPADQQEALKAQLSKEEDAAVDNVGDWPDIPDQMAAQIASWDPIPVAPDLVALRADAVLAVDRSAEKFRMQFITPGFGQVMTYQQKLSEAQAKLANASIADADIPHIVSEAAADGMSKTEKAQQIVDTFHQWQQISAGVEGLRMAAKKAVAEATTAEAIAAACSVNWSSLV